MLRRANAFLQLAPVFLRLAGNVVGTDPAPELLSARQVLPPAVAPEPSIFLIPSFQALVASVDDLTKTTLAVAASRDSPDHQPKVEFRWSGGIPGLRLLIEPGACYVGLGCGGKNQ